jgi:hypothetical protein
VVRDNRVRRWSGEGERTGEHFVQEAAERVHIAASVDLLAHGLLWAHVRGCTEGHSDLSEALRTSRRTIAAAVGKGLRDAEIGDDRHAVGQEDVFRLDVAMNHAVAVRVVDGTTHNGSYPDGFVDRQGTVPLDARAQRFAVDERHDVEERAAHLSRIEERKNIRMLEIGRDANLGEKTLGAEHGTDLGIENLERYRAMVSEIAREVDAR